MRAMMILGGVLLLAACSKQDPGSDPGAAGTDSTAASIVSNDITAIDAVTGDAANIAAETPIDLAETNSAQGNGPAAAKPAARAPAPAAKSAPKPASRPAPADTPAEPQSNSAG